jgi:hypothetical protein
LSGTSSLRVASFWHGPRLSALDAACLYSFVLSGFDVTLYSYDEVENVPNGIRLADAEDVVKREFIGRFKVMGRASIPHFADYFRCCLFRKTGTAWIDSDILCLRPFSIETEKTFLAKQANDLIGNAILRIHPADAMLSKLINSIEKIADNRDHRYGASGPYLITEMYGSAGLADAFDPKYFFPIPSDKWWIAFLPSERLACEEACAEANVLHLWNNCVDESGIWKDILPPKGSFLNEQLTRRGMDVFFKGTYPEAVLEAIVNNYKFLETASHMPLRKLLNVTVKRCLERSTVLLSSSMRPSSMKRVRPSQRDKA